MKSTWRRLLCLIAALAVAISTLPAPMAVAATRNGRPVRASEDGIQLPANGQIIVKFNEVRTASNVAGLVAQGGGRVVKQDRGTRMLVKLPDVPSHARALVAGLRGMQGVEYIENNDVMKAYGSPNDERYSELWGLQRMQAEAAWSSIDPMGDPVVVAVLDTGVDSGHEDLSQNIMDAGSNFVGYPTDTYDDNGHGTHVSGTIAGVYNNGVGITGVAGPANVQILPVKVLDASGTGTNYDIADGIYYAVDSGVDVINLSLGGSYSRTVDEAVRYAVNRGVVVVAAAGNEDADTAALSPAGAPGALTVAALAEGGTPADFSNYGDQVEVIAPGVRILSTYPGNQYVTGDGTSMAAAHVAGLAALIKAAHPDWSRWQIQTCLYETVEKLPVADKYGLGVPRADRAIDCDPFASELVDKYAMKLESPDPGSAVQGNARLTFDVLPDVVARIEVADQDGQVRGSAEVVGDSLVDVDTDLFGIGQGPVTLTATAYDNTGVPVVTKEIDLTVGKDTNSIQVKVYDPDGQPAAYAPVELYHKVEQRYGDSVYSYWQGIDYVGSDNGWMYTDANGVLKLSQAAFPPGNEFLAIAWVSQSTGEETVEGVRYGLFGSPGTYELKGDLVETEVVIDVPVDGGEFVVSPLEGDLELPPIWLGAKTPEAGSFKVLLPAGEYDSWFVADGYFLAETVTIDAGESQTITVDDSDTVALSWESTAGRQYTEMFMTLNRKGDDYSIWFRMPLDGGWVRVKRDTYEPSFSFDLAGETEEVWSYGVSGAPVTVDGDTSVSEGTLSSLALDAPETARPGTTWSTWNEFATDTGNELSWVYRVTGYSSSLSMAAKAGAPVVSPLVPGKVQSFRTLSRPGSAPGRQLNAASLYVEVTPRLEVYDAAGKKVNQDAHTSSDIYSSSWRIPVNFKGGSFTAQVSLDAGPFGSASATVPLSVSGEATIADGVRVKVVDAAGNAIRDAQVALLEPYESDGKSLYIKVDVGFTDEDGYVLFTGPWLEHGAEMKVAVFHDSQMSEPWAVIRDVTLPADLVVDPTQTRPVRVTAESLKGGPLAGTGEISFAFADEAGDPIFGEYIGGTDEAGGVLINLEPGSYRFGVTDWQNHGYYVSDVVDLSADETGVAVAPEGDLVRLGLGSLTAADGTALLPGFSLVIPDGLPDALLLGYEGEAVEWQVSPGVYEHIGDYVQLPADGTSWVYEIAGSVEATAGETKIDLGGGFSAQIDAPRKTGENGYYFYTDFPDSYGNSLVGLASEDPDFESDYASLGEAVRNHDGKALREHPKVLAMRHIAALRKADPELQIKADMGIQNHMDLAPFLIVQSADGEEIWRNKEQSNWYRALFFAPQGARGTHTAEILLGAGPVEVISDTVTFEVSGGVSLDLSTTQLNPSKGTLKISLELSEPAKYTLTVENDKDEVVRTLAKGKSYSGPVEFTWNGRNDRNKTVPNGRYSVHLVTEAGDQARAFFNLRVPPVAPKPAIKANPTVTNQDRVTVEGTSAQGFLVQFQVKAPGESEFELIGVTAAADSKGGFRTEIPLGTAEGIYEIRAQSVEQGYPENVSAWSTALEVTRDTSAPVVRLVKPAPAEGQVFTNQNKLTLEGTTEPYATVTAVAGNDERTQTKSATADRYGKWKVSSLPLQEGENTLTLTATDPAGNESAAVQFRVQADTTRPELAKAEDGKPALQLRIMRNGQWEDLPPVVGKGNSLNFFLSGADATAFELVGTASEPLGELSISPAVKNQEVILEGASFRIPIQPKADRTTSYTLGAVDLAGNSNSALGKVSVQLDSTGPNTRINLPSEKEITAVNDHESGVARVKLVGSANEDLSQVRVIDAETGAQVDARITFDPKSSKKFTAEVSLPLDESKTYKLRVVGYDMAGNQGAADKRQADVRLVSVDMTPPAAPVITSPVIVDGTTASRSTTLKVSGRAEARATVEATVGESSARTATVDSRGNFSLSLPLGEGLSSVELVVVDPAGNRSPVTAFTVTVDRKAPVLDEESLSFMAGSEEVALTESKGRFYGSTKGADQYRLSGRFDETLASVVISGKKGLAVEVADNSFSVDLSSVIKDGTNSLTVEAADLAGNTAKTYVILTVDTVKPKVTISEKDILTGVERDEEGDPRPVVFTVTGSESLSDVRVVNAADGLEIDLPVEVNPDRRSDEKWTVAITFPAESQTWEVRFLGVDLAGNVSDPDAKGKDVRRVTVDPTAPSLSLESAPAGVIYTDGDDPELGIAKKQITVSGSVADDDSGVAGVLINGKLTKVDASGTFSAKVTLQEGKLTSIAVTGVDKAGNRSDTQTLNVLMKTTIGKLTLNTPRWDKKAERLTISGTTDPAIKLGEEWVAAVPLKVLVTDSAENAVYEGTLTAGNDGRFTLTLETDTWEGEGRYTVVVTALAPEEFSGASFSKSATKTVTIDR